VKPAGPIPPGGDFSMPIPSNDPSKKSPEVFLATATMSCVVRHDGLSPASEWPVDWHTRPSWVRSDKAELQLIVQHASPEVVLLPVTSFEDRQVRVWSGVHKCSRRVLFAPSGFACCGSSSLSGSPDLARGSPNFAGW
jgi:hypothetical protein